MNLLHQYKVKFDWTNTVRSWDNEYAFGFAIDDKLRGIDKQLSHYMSYFGIKFVQHYSVNDDDPTMYWDVSYGVYGASYINSPPFPVGQRMEESEIRTAWAIEREKWTWEGAPEFRDWNYNAKQRVESVFIRFLRQLF